MRSAAIVGRPNVGKSALFNRLAGRQISIVHDQPGVTRDRIIGICRLGSVPFEVVDTGGLGANLDRDLSRFAQEAAEAAIEGSDLLLFVVDGQVGATPMDFNVAERVRRSGRPAILVVNKVDAAEHEDFVLDFARLGFSQTLGVSAAHGRGIAELVEVVQSLLPAPDDVSAPPAAPRLAFVGRPNVGKSSLINTIAGDRRAIVSHMPGTTRDAMDVVCERDGTRFILCDTAGIRHRSKHNTSVEVFSVRRAENAIKRADLCVLVIDATSGVRAQDKKIAGLIQKARKAALIALNKWDLVLPEKGSNTLLLSKHIEEARQKLFFLDYAPVVVLSAKTGGEVPRLFRVIEKIRQHANCRAGTGELNRLLRSEMERQPPPLAGKRRFKLLYATQKVPLEPRPFQGPEFLLFVNNPRLVPQSYLNFLRARLRQRWRFLGLPILLSQRGREHRAPAP
jgi:GTP-binding protein